MSLMQISAKRSCRLQNIHLGAKIHGKHYVYNPIDDSLIREDVVKWIAYHKKSKEAPKKPVDQSQQLDMDY